MKVLDLFSGLGGFSAAFRERGHGVVCVDIVPPADVIADVRHLPIKGQFDVILASPPCTEFSRESMPWKKTGKAPSLELVHATLAAIGRIKPHFWALENVRGAVAWLKPILGHYRLRAGSRYLWGNFPLFWPKAEYGKEKLGPNIADRARIRGKIPYSLSLDLCCQCEEQMNNANER